MVVQVTCKFNRRVTFLGYGSFPGRYPALRRYVSCIPFARSGFRVSTCAALRALSLSFSLNLLLLLLASGFCCLATAALLLRRCVFPFFSSCSAKPPYLLQQVGKSCTTFIVNKRQRNIIAQVWLYYSMIGSRAHGFSLAKFYI